MSRDANINPFYWSLWAQRLRGNLAQNGYPKQVPFYTTPVLGNVYDNEPGSSGGHISDRDIAVVEDIERALALHRGRRPQEVRALEIWEGAYVGADPEREARMAFWGVSYDAVQKAARRAKLAVEKYMFTLA